MKIGLMAKKNVFERISTNGEVYDFVL